MRSWRPGASGRGGLPKLDHAALYNSAWPASQWLSLRGNGPLAKARGVPPFPLKEADEPVAYRFCRARFWFCVLRRRAAEPCRSETFEGTAYTVCSFDPAKDDLRMFWGNGEGAPYNTFRRARRRR